MWLGKHSGAMTFRVPNSKEKDSLVVDDVGNKWHNFGNICWYTNLDLPHRHVDLILYKNYNPNDCPTKTNHVRTLPLPEFFVSRIESVL